MEILKNFAVLEGCDGSGTTSQLNLLGNSSPENPILLPPLYKTYEPTNGSIGTLIRSCLRGEMALKPETVALLFAADRYEHVYGPGGIEERCKKGELVVSDRYLFSSLVYQGITCGEDLPALLNRDFPCPELLLYLDVESGTALERIAGRGQREIFDNQDFQTEAGRRYKALLPSFASNGVMVVTIDASLPPDEVAHKVWTALLKMPIFKR